MYRSDQDDSLLLNGSLPKAVRFLAIPMVLEMTMESVFAVADVFFVGRLGTDAIAVVGLTEAMLTFVYALAFGTATGTNAVVSRRIGEGRPHRAAQAAAQGIWLGTAISVLVAGLGLLLAPYLLLAMGASPALAAKGSAFVGIALGGNITIMLLFINNAAFRGAGDAKIAMWSLWLANGINLVLDPLLIFGLGPVPALGLEGAAIATIIGRGAGVAYQLTRMRRGASRLRLDGAALRPRWTVMSLVGRLSLGAMVQELIETSSWTLLVRILTSFGDAAVAGYTIALRVLIFALLPAWGLGNAAATLVGQNLGAQQPERAERAVWLTGLFGMAFLLVVSLATIPLAAPLIGLFSQQWEVVVVGADCLQIIACGYVFYAWGMVIVLAFNGAGDTITPTILNVTALWLVKLPCAYWLAHHWELGPRGVFIAVTLSYSLLAVLGVVVFRRGRWKTRVV